MAKRQILRLRFYFVMRTLVITVLFYGSDCDTEKKTLPAKGFRRIPKTRNLVLHLTTTRIGSILQHHRKIAKGKERQQELKLRQCVWLENFGYRHCNDVHVTQRGQLNTAWMLQWRSTKSNTVIYILARSLFANCRNICAEPLKCPTFPPPAGISSTK